VEWGVFESNYKHGVILTVVALCKDEAIFSEKRLGVSVLKLGERNLDGESLIFNVIVRVLLFGQVS
jgi:hypothetical protein